MEVGHDHVGRNIEAGARARRSDLPRRGGLLCRSGRRRQRRLPAPHRTAFCRHLLQFGAKLLRWQAIASIALTLLERGDRDVRLQPDDTRRRPGIVAQARQKNLDRRNELGRCAAALWLGRPGRCGLPGILPSAVLGTLGRGFDSVEAHRIAVLVGRNRQLHAGLELAENLGRHVKHHATRPERAAGRSEGRGADKNGHGIGFAGPQVPVGRLHPQRPYALRREAQADAETVSLHAVDRAVIEDCRLAPCIGVDSPSADLRLRARNRIGIGHPCRHSGKTGQEQDNRGSA